MNPKIKERNTKKGKRGRKGGGDNTESCISPGRRYPTATGLVSRDTLLSKPEL